jgi:hypothetical protein
MGGMDSTGRVRTDGAFVDFMTLDFIRFGSAQSISLHP